MNEGQSAWWESEFPSRAPQSGGDRRCHLSGAEPLLCTGCWAPETSDFDCLSSNVEDTASHFHSPCRHPVMGLSCQTLIENRCKNADEQAEHHPQLEVSEAVERWLQRLEEAAEVRVLP